MHFQRAVDLFHEGEELRVVLVYLLNAQDHLAQREGLEVRGLLGDASALVSKQGCRVPRADGQARRRSTGRQN